MKFGLEQHIIDTLIAVFEQNSKVDKALVFGSRAKGNYRPDSDIDIAIKGQDLSTDDIIAMSLAIEEKGITHKIDLINYHTIKEPDLIDHIDRVGIELYSIWQKTEIGILPSDWRLMTLDEIKSKEKKAIISGPFGSNISSKYFVSNGIPVIRGNNLSLGLGKKFNDDGFVFITEEKANELGTWAIKDDIVFTAVGTIGQVGILLGNEKYPKYIISNKQLRLRVDKEIVSPLFAYYWFASPEMIDTIEQRNTGSSVPLINLSVLKSLYIPIPQKWEQKLIVQTLSSLDDKIDLLHRQNKTLEQLAETLFRQWFVEEAEGSWELEPLGKVFDIGIGRTPPRKEQHWFTLNPNDIKWVSIKDMGTSGIYLDTVSEYLTQEAVEQYSVPIIPENTVMLSFKMTIGRLAISTEKMVSNEAIAHFKQKEGSFLFPEFLYLFLKTYSWVELGSTSSIVESINSQMIKEIEMIIPNKEKLIAFKEMIIPTFDKIKSNQKQIRTLTQTRDNLLPKLMSGEIRLNLDLLD